GPEVGLVVPANAGTHNPWRTCWCKTPTSLPKPKRRGVWVPACAGTTMNMTSRSRDALRPRFAITFAPKRKRAQRDPQGRARGMPGVRCTRGRTKCGSLPQVHRSQPAFPARWFYGFLRALPGDRALLRPSPLRSVYLLKDLTPASGRQDHTTSPSAITPFVH